MHLSLPLLLVIQLYVCMEMNMQRNTRISLNDFNFHLLFFPPPQTKQSDKKQLNKQITCEQM